MERARTGYTTWELVVTGVLVLIVVGVVTPLFSRTRGRADTAACRTNLKGLASAWLIYVNDYDECLPVVWGAGHDLRERLGLYCSQAGFPVCPAARPRGVGYAYNGMLRDDLEQAYPLEYGKIRCDFRHGDEPTVLFWCTGDGQAGAPVIGPGEEAPRAHATWRPRHERRWATVFSDGHVALVDQAALDRRRHPVQWGWEAGKHPLSYGARIVRSEGGSYDGRATALCDGSDCTGWMLNDGADGGWLELELPTCFTFSRLEIRGGSEPAAFDAFAPSEGGWREFHRFAGHGPEKPTSFPPVTTQRIRLRIHRSDGIDWHGDGLREIELW